MGVTVGLETIMKVAVVADRLEAQEMVEMG